MAAAMTMNTAAAGQAQGAKPKLSYLERLIIAFDKLNDEQHKRDATLFMEGMAAATFDNDTQKKA